MVTERGSDKTRLGDGVGRARGVGVLAALEGVALILWHLVATPFIGRRRLRWGTVGTEATDPLPGDGLVPRPKWFYTLGVAVDASPEEVWPWIAQIGQGRGGFYTYQTLENLAGCQITNTAEILSVHQHPAVGELIHLHPTAPPMRVEIVNPPSTLVLFRVTRRPCQREELGSVNLAVHCQPRTRWRMPTPDEGPLRPLAGLEKPARVRALSNRSDYLRDEPQDDARDQEAGRVSRPATSSEAPVSTAAGRGGTSHNPPARPRPAGLS